MQKFKFLLLFVFTVFSLLSCSTEPIDPLLNIDNPGDGNDQPNNGIPFFKVDFSGITWNAESTTVYISGNTIKLEALRGTQNEAFGFILNGNTVGNYLANTNLVAYVPPSSQYGYSGLNLTNPNENTGSVTITSINTVNKTISGNFTFKGYWSNSLVTNVPPINFTNGSFKNLSYVTENPVINDFFAKIDGTEFVDTDITTGIANNYIAITAKNSAFDDISLGIKDTLPVGTYPITNSTTTVNNCTALYHLSNVSYYANSGTLTILSKTATRIKGTFQFIGTSGTTNHTVTEGTFNVEY